MATADRTREADENLLKELGYNQDLNRAWSGFSNFAISFSIISVLAGCFTTYGQAWNNGGPIAISVGWPLISIPILIIGFCLAELVSRYPTSGGIYWFSGKLGSPRAAWYTGWFNWIGLVGVVASVQYASAFFLASLLGLYSVDLGIINFADSENFLRDQFFVFVAILIITTIINIFRTHLLAVINNISVWWHVLGVAVIIAILVFVPDDHQSASFVFSERINNSGFDGGSIAGIPFWFLVLPLGFLLTQYTITGFDASAHLSEETIDSSTGSARGVWQSIFYSAIIGWFVLLAITFAATDVDAITRRRDLRSRLLAGGVQRGALERGVQGGAAHLDDRAALLRPRVPDQRVADVLRVVTRRRIRNGASRSASRWSMARAFRTRP